jgi:hypothetical protein
MDIPRGYLSKAFASMGMRLWRGSYPVPVEFGVDE